MFSTTTNTINKISPSSAIVSGGSCSTNKGRLFPDSDKCYQAAEDAAWPKLPLWKKFFLIL